jgi:FG-GAP-like repeat
MAVKLDRYLLVGLVWGLLAAHDPAASEVGGPPSPPDARPEADEGNLVIDPGSPPLPMTPEVRTGFLMRKAADYGVAAADFDGDGRADLSIKLDGGTWRIDYAVNGFGQWDRTVISYGGPAATPVPADYDGDHRADLAVKDDTGRWLIDYAADGFGTWNVQLGGYRGRSARAVPADYDGDGRADLAVKDDASGIWYIDYAADGFGSWNVSYPGYGGANADPVPGDYDGDRRADLAVKDDTGRWYIDYAADGFGSWNVSYPGYGDARAHAVPADYDGDGRADLAVKADDGRWYIDYSANGFGAWNAVIPAAGGTTARAVPADYDGDGRADLGVRVDCGPWFIDQAANGFGPWNQRFDHMTARDVVTATDASHLAYTLASDFTGTVFIPSNTTIGLGSLRELPVKSCVQILGTRHATDPGPLLYTDDKTEPYPLFLVTGHDARIKGVRLRGPSNGDRSASQELVTGIMVQVDAGLGLGGNVAIEGNEAWFWTGSAVYVLGQVPRVESPAEVPAGTPVMTFDQAGLVRVARNSLHHNSRDGSGYGVNVSHGAYATIEGNVFDYNRHAIASGGQPYTGYVARYNYVLEGGYTESGYWNQHFDVHGTGDGGYGSVAGERYDVVLNTFRGEQDYPLGLGLETRRAFLLRGTPTVGAFFHHNVLVHDDRGEAVKVKSPDCWVQVGYGGYYSDELCHLTVGLNTYDTDTTGDLGVGDFDGDGLDDVFLANGTGWWYSSAGRTEWRFLRPSSLRIAALRFGQFDLDRRTDVLFSTGAEWQFSSGGVAEPVRLRASGTSLSSCVFGDFDGNGLTDALYATGSTWYLSHDAKGSWATIRSSVVTAANLRVGDFDGDGSDDVFDVEHGRWSWWRLGWTEAYPLNGALTSSASGLVVGDFDGDGRDDIAQTSGFGWRYSRGGSSPWTTLRGSGNQAQYADIGAVVVGRFGLDHRDDALRYELTPYWAGGSLRYKAGVRFVGWDGTQDAFAQWSPEYVR